MEIFDNELSGDFTLLETAGSVGMDSMSELLDYYCDMLNLALETMSKLTDQSKTQVRSNFEEELDRVGQLNVIKSKLQASNEVIKDVLTSERWEDVIE